LIESPSTGDPAHCPRYAQRPGKLNSASPNYVYIDLFLGKVMWIDAGGNYYYPQLKLYYLQALETQRAHIAIFIFRELKAQHYNCSLNSIASLY
jgi:hypothetical protein